MVWSTLTIKMRFPTVCVGVRWNFLHRESVCGIYYMWEDSHEHVDIHVCACMWRTRAVPSFIPQLLQLVLLSETLSMNLELKDSAWVRGQQYTGILLFGRLQHWDCSAILSLSMGNENDTLVLTIAWWARYLLMHLPCSVHSYFFMSLVSSPFVSPSQTFTLSLRCICLTDCKYLHLNVKMYFQFNMVPTEVIISPWSNLACPFNISQ